MNKEFITYNRLKDFFEKKGFDWNASTDEVNVVGVRSFCKIKNRFNDWICLAWIDNYNNEQIKIYKATTLPGEHYLLKPINKKGTAILIAGQYKNTYKLDLHRNKYLALCQRLKQVHVVRDNNLDTNVDFENPSADEWGFFGINIHRAHRTWLAQFVNFYSAGCQVIVKNKNFQEFIKILKTHSEIYGNCFTYTLIDDYELIKKNNI